MANEMDFLRYAYSPPRTFMKRTAGLLPSYQFPQEVMYDEPGIEPGIAYSTADMMPPAQQMPAAVPPPATFAPRPNPLLDESLYTPTPRPVQQPLDFSRFQYPEAPRYRMPGAAPARDLGMERGFTQQRSLRAALLGALLGGGTGAIAGLTGAQQGAQQAFEQDYAQRMADYQNQARLMDIENQQLAAADQRAIAMRNAQVGEALKAYGMEGDRLNAEYEAAEAVRKLRIERARAIAEGDKARIESVDSILKGLLDVAPEDQLAYIQARVTGQLPTTPIRPATKAPAPPSGTTMQNVVERLLSIGYLMTPEDYRIQARNAKSMLLASSDPVVQAMALQIPDERPPTSMTLRGQAELRRGKEFEKKFGQGERRLDEQKAANDERARHNRAMEGISSDRNRITEIHNRWTRTKKPGAKLDVGSTKTIVDGFNRVSKEIATMEAKLTKPGYNTEILGGPIRERIVALRSQLKSDFVDQFGDQFRFGGIESGTPTITRKQTPAVVPEPATVPKPEQGGEWVEVTVNGRKIRYRRK